MAKLDEAVGHYRKSFGASAAAAKELNDALAGFNEVSDALQALAAEFQNAPALDDKILEVNQARVDCRKRHALGG
jgi:hypothetical protein